jgi:hypothetical protein
MTRLIQAQQRTQLRIHGQRQQAAAHHRAPRGDGQLLKIAAERQFAPSILNCQAHTGPRTIPQTPGLPGPQARRFERREQFPAAHPANRAGVDYGMARWCTGGAPAGRPMLFEYFLPEKWRRTPRTKISSSQQMFKTVTNDNVRVVWRVSRVGQIPDADPFVDAEARILAHGYNSPFEEFSIAMELSRLGIETTYPRAIYMTGHRTTVSSALADNSRYESHAGLCTPDGHAILSEHHEYVTIWGYWNGPDDVLAMKDEAVYKGIDALAAYREGRLTKREYVRVMRAASTLLAAAGIEDLSLRGTHLLLSIDRQQQLAADKRGLPLVRICNFELLKRT